MNVTSSTPGRNVLSFKLSGSEKMRIASDGSVGIGTAAPATTLDVSGTTTLKGTTNLSNNNIISIGNAGIGTAAPAYKLDVIGSGSDNIVCRLQSGGANTATTYVNTGASNLDVGTGSGGHFIYGYGSYPLYFGVNGSEKMRITSAGNVGIGTSAPTSIHHIYGSLNNALVSTIENASSDSSSYAQFILKTDQTNVFSIFKNSSTRTSDGGINTTTIRNEGGKLRLQNYEGDNEGITIWGSSVGIGTSTPQQILQVGNGGRLRISNSITDYTLIGTKETDDVSNTRIVLSGYDRTDLNGSIDYVATNTGAHVFRTSNSGSERMRITESGNVGIGTSSPSVALDVSGTVKVSAFVWNWEKNISGTFTSPYAQILEYFTLGMDVGSYEYEVYLQFYTYSIPNNTYVYMYINNDITTTNYRSGYTWSTNSTTSESSSNNGNLCMVYNWGTSTIPTFNTINMKFTYLSSSDVLQIRTDITQGRSDGSTSISALHMQGRGVIFYRNTSVLSSTNKIINRLKFYSGDSYNVFGSYIFRTRISGVGGL